MVHIVATKRGKVIGHVLRTAKVHDRALGENHDEVKEAEDVAAWLVQRAQHLWWPA